MSDLNGLTALHPRARLTMRAQPGHPDLAHETRIRLAIAERNDLVEQRRSPHMGIINEPGSHMTSETLQRVRNRRPAVKSQRVVYELSGSDGPRINLSCIPARCVELYQSNA
jgi:hypothetical protein